MSRNKIEDVMELIMHIKQAEAFFDSVRTACEDNLGIGFWELLEEFKRTDTIIGMSGDMLEGMPPIEKQFHIFTYLAAKHSQAVHEEEPENPAIAVIRAKINDLLHKTCTGGGLREMTDTEIDELGDTVAQAEKEYNIRLRVFTDDGAIQMFPESVRERLQYINDRVAARRRLAGVTDEDTGIEMPEGLSDRLKDIISQIVTEETR